MNKRYEITEYVIRWSKRYNKLIKIPLEDKRERIKETKENGIRTVIDPELKITECTKEFTSSRKGAKKREGYVKLHPAFRTTPKNEYETAKMFANEYGYYMMVDKENTRETNKSYVDLFDGKRWWEEKSPSTLSAIRTRLKTGLHQLAEFKQSSIGGVILNISDGVASNSEIKHEILNAINEHSRINCYVIARKNGEILAIYKVRHKK